MNYKSYQEGVKKARDNYYRVKNDIAHLEDELVGTDYHVTLCRDLLRAVSLIRALESVDIPVKEIKEDALL